MQKNYHMAVKLYEIQQRYCDNFSLDSLHLASLDSLAPSSEKVGKFSEVTYSSPPDHSYKQLLT